MDRGNLLLPWFRIQPGWAKSHEWCADSPRFLPSLWWSRLPN